MLKPCWIHLKIADPAHQTLDSGFLLIDRDQKNRSFDVVWRGVKGGTGLPDEISKAVGIPAEIVDLLKNITSELSRLAALDFYRIRLQ